MELVTLDSNYQPDRIIEDYSSLIWAERYSSAGDFELQTTLVEDTLNLLPLESCVSLRESTVPMVVEIHKIVKKPKAAPVLVVKGRSADASYLERRGSVSTLLPAAKRPVWNITAEKESDAAYQAMRIVLGDVARYQDEVQVLGEIDPAISPNDALSMIDQILPADFETGTSNSYEIKAGNLYTTILELLTTNHHGLKAVRPIVGSSQIGIEIYNGADLTETVVFDVKFDQFDSATYLLSRQGQTDWAYVYGSNGAQAVAKTASPEPSGLERRVLVLDQAEDTTASTSDIRNIRGLIELYKYNATALFDGQISVQIAEGYNSDYFLGDIVKMNGEYGLSELVRVEEFIRTSDASGEKAYPAFQVIDESVPST